MPSIQGHLLIASPQLLDPNFHQTVVLMVQHNENGALGLILNRPTSTTLDEAWRQISDKPCERQDALNVGGPCQGVLMVLHTDDACGDPEVLPGLFFTTDAQRIERIVQDADLRCRFFVGYAGWTAGQLEAELETGSWLTAPAELEQIFDASDALWTRVRRQAVWASNLTGFSPRIIPVDPSAN